MFSLMQVLRGPAAGEASERSRQQELCHYCSVSSGEENFGPFARVLLPL